MYKKENNFTSSLESNQNSKEEFLYSMFGPFSLFFQLGGFKLLPLIKVQLPAFAGNFSSLKICVLLTPF